MASSMTASSSPPKKKAPVRRHRTPGSHSKELQTLRANKDHDELKASRGRTIVLFPNSAAMLASCRSVASIMNLVESKREPPSKKELLPHTLRPRDHDLSYELSETKESVVLRDTFRNIFGDKHYNFRISTALNMSSSGAGIVNSTISNSVLVSNPDFISLSAVFNEFFVVKFQVHWVPVSRYQYPLGGTSTISVANLPIGKADLQHGQAAYSSLSTMADNFAVRFHSTGDPFTDEWVNTEKNTEQVVASLTAPTQSWCTVNNASNYQGTLQYLSQSAPPALPFSQVLGTFMAHWHIQFRVRL